MEHPGVGSVERAPVKLTCWPDCGAWLSATGFATGFRPGALMVKLLALVAEVIWEPFEFMALTRIRACVEAKFPGIAQTAELADDGAYKTELSQFPPPSKE